MRHQFIPVRKVDLGAALAADSALPAAPSPEQFAQFCRLLALSIHYEAYEELEALKGAYFHFNPRLGGSAQRSDAGYAELVTGLERVLKRGNFVEIGADEIALARRSRGMLPVDVRAALDGYRGVRMFARGSHRERLDGAGILPGFRSRPQDVDVYDDVVLFAATKSSSRKDKRASTRSATGPSSSSISTTSPAPISIRFCRTYGW